LSSKPKALIKSVNEPGESMVSLRNNLSHILKRQSNLFSNQKLVWMFSNSVRNLYRKDIDHKGAIQKSYSPH
jgi:hypothetical protein